MPTYTVEDTVGFNITVAPSTKATIVSSGGVDASVTFPGPQGPKGDTGPAGPAATDTAQTWTQRQTFQRNADDTPLVIKSNVAQTTDLTQWQNNAGAVVAKIKSDGEYQNDVAGSGVVVTSPDGLLKRRIGIDNTGAITVTAV